MEPNKNVKIDENNRSVPWGFEDAFGKQIVDTPATRADISSEYDYSPERHRLFINGTRIFLQYGANAKFDDTGDVYTLKPAAEDYIEFRTAERFRYAVGYAMSVSCALQTNQSLNSGDYVAVGYGEVDMGSDGVNTNSNADGWFWEWIGGESDNQVHLTWYRDGTKLVDETVTTEKAVDEWKRLEDRISWYNVGNRQSFETYTSNGEQFNTLIKETSYDTGRGPISANHRLTVGVYANTGTTGLEVEVGSQGVINLGNAIPVFRVKEAVQTGSHTGGGNWEPLFAVRIDPDRLEVDAQLSEMRIGELSATDVDCQIMAISVGSSKTDAGTWGVPEYHSASNSVIQETTSVTTFPDSTGSVGTSASNPGGYQLGFAATYTSGTGTNNVRTQSADRTRKRQIHNGDIVIFIAKLTNGSAVDVTVEYETEQQW